MRSMKRSALGLGVVLILVTLLIALSPSLSESQGQGQGGQQPIAVNVVNTPNTNVVNTASVNVVNTPTVRDVDNPARQPVHASVTRSPTNSTRYTVPPGKRLVIEFVSGSASIHNGDFTSVIIRTALGSPAAIDHTFVLTPAYHVSGTKGYTFAQPTRLYADAGTDVSVSYGYLGVGTNEFVLAVISGYLVDVP